MFIPAGYDPEKYKLAQERMYGIAKRRDVLRDLIRDIDRQLEETMDEARKLLFEFPTLSLRARKPANPPYTVDDPPPAGPDEEPCPQCGAKIQSCPQGEYCSNTACSYVA